MGEFHIPALTNYTRFQPYSFTLFTQVRLGYPNAPMEPSGVLTALFPHR